MPLGAVARRAVGTTIEVKRHRGKTDAWVVPLSEQMHFAYFGGNFSLTDFRRPEAESLKGSTCLQAG